MEQSLAKLLDGIATSNQYGNMRVTGLASHSNQVRDGYLYLAMQGQQTHGLDFLPAAVAHGARVVAWEKTQQTYSDSFPIPAVAIEDLKQQAGVIADRFFEHPSQALNVIAVTGTNGKTSVVHLVSEALSIKYGGCGCIGTLGMGEFGALRPSPNTTPEALLIHAEMYALKDQGIKSVVLEASSHGLVQHRLAGVDIDVGVFTLLGRDHFDYHGSLEAYAKAKKSLFEMECLKYAVLNKEDLFSREMAEACQSGVTVLTYSSGDTAADFSAREIYLDRKGLSFDVVSSDHRANIQSSLIGRFNVSCLLAAFATLITQGISFAEAAQLLSQVRAIPGRMQQFARDAMPLAILDYAHTPDALEAALKACREIVTGELYCVFGCGGERDRGKRALMGRIASRFSDHILLTDDNPRNEDSDHIIANILEGVEDFSQLKIIHDRRQAVLLAIKSASESDCVLVTGKGHETYQQVGTEQMPMDDAELIDSAFSEVTQCRG